jgi:hypothetical protein
MSLPQCDHCKTIQKVRKCGSCKNVAYCSVECQKNDWASHKAVCSFKKKTKAKVCIVDSTEITEKECDLKDLGDLSAWHPCELPAKLGVPVVAKRLTQMHKYGSCMNSNMVIFTFFKDI